MNSKQGKLSDDEIDEIVISEANDDSKWTKPLSVRPKRTVPIFLTPRVAEKLKTEARKRHVKNYHQWVNKIVEQHLAGRP